MQSIKSRGKMLSSESMCGIRQGLIFPNEKAQDLAHEPQMESLVPSCNLQPAHM